MELSGTLKLTNAPGAIITSLPILTFPITIEFAFIHTLLPIVGTPAFFPSELPIKQPWLILKLRPIVASGLTTIAPKCTILKPLSIFVMPVFVYQI